MTENIEWGACPVCGGRVTGEVDSWECNGRLHVKHLTTIPHLRKRLSP